MTSNHLRALTWLLVALVAACSAPPATPTTSSGSTTLPTPAQTPVPTSPSVIPTALATPSGPPVSTPPPTLPSGPIADALAPELDVALEEQLAQYRIPGMTAEIIFPDGSRWSGADGFADLGRELEAIPDTTFVTGSISKTFVTAAVMQLQEEGVLSIDDPLADWLPDHPNAENMTLRQLLSHTSGVYNYFLHPEYNARVFNEPDHAWTPQEVLDEFVLEPKFPPGTGYHYSNTNFVLLGLVVEEATGQPLGEVFRERFFAPLELGDTYCQCGGPPAAGSARGYLVRATGPVGLDDGTDYRPTLSAARVAYGAGDIVSTAADLADWARTVYGGHLLAAESLTQMTDYNYSPDARGEYGLGTRTRVFDGERMFGHTGSLRGYAAAMWHLPGTDLTIVVLTNRGRLEANPIVNALAQIALPIAGAY
ncbi:MAG: serine hydrolase domain-containing protein [Candidatus Limnocylindrales bacterium]